VLVLLVNEHLFRLHPEAPEGRLSKLKARYVSEPSLALAAAHLGLGDYLALAPSDAEAGARARPSILSDAFEAVLAAIYLARGLEEARAFLRSALLGQVDPEEVWDHKSRLQEWVQERHRVTPAYETEQEGGPAHQPVFRSVVSAGERKLGEGAGPTKKAAEQAAAEAALAALLPGE
jgi:ribonuclease-3